MRRNREWVLKNSAEDYSLLRRLEARDSGPAVKARNADSPGAAIIGRNTRRYYSTAEYTEGSAITR